MQRPNVNTNIITIWLRNQQQRNQPQLRNLQPHRQRGSLRELESLRIIRMVQQRHRLTIWAQVLVWTCAAIFVLSETYLIHHVPLSGILTIVIFGGAGWAMHHFETDKYDLFCWYHKTMAWVCASVGVFDILNFYTDWIPETIINTLFAILKITLIAAAIQVIYKWVQRQRAEIKSGQ